MVAEGGDVCYGFFVQLGKEGQKMARVQPKKFPVQQILQETFHRFGNQFTEVSETCWTACGPQNWNEHTPFMRLAIEEDGVMVLRVWKDRETADEKPDNPFRKFMAGVRRGIGKPQYAVWMESFDQPHFFTHSGSRFIVSLMSAIQDMVGSGRFELGYVRE